MSKCVFFNHFFIACGERQGGESFLDSVDSSGWLKHIKCVVDTSYFIAKVENLRFFRFFKDV